MNGIPEINFMQIKQTLLKVYNNLWFAINMIKFTELGTVFNVYEPTSVYPETFRERDNDQYMMTFAQSRDRATIVWSVKAFNEVWG